jgi:hypothetical protein
MQVENVYPEVSKLQLISESINQAYLGFVEFLASNSKELSKGLSNAYRNALESTDE